MHTNSTINAQVHELRAAVARTFEISSIRALRADVARFNGALNYLAAQKGTDPDAVLGAKSVVAPTALEIREEIAPALTDLAKFILDTFAVEPAGRKAVQQLCKPIPRINRDGETVRNSFGEELQDIPPKFLLPEGFEETVMEKMKATASALLQR